MAFVEQRRHDLRRRTVDEARAGEHIEDLLALGFTLAPGRALDGAAGARELTSDDGRSSPVDTPSAWQAGATPTCAASGWTAIKSAYPCSRFNPSSPATFPWGRVQDRVRGVQLMLQASALDASSARKLRIQRVAFGRFQRRASSRPTPAASPCICALRQAVRCEQSTTPRGEAGGPPRRAVCSDPPPRRIRSRYSAVNWRRFGLATTSGSGVGLARPALGASSLRSSTPRAGTETSFNVIESLSAVIGLDLRRPTEIPKVAGVSVMLAERVGLTPARCKPTRLGDATYEAKRDAYASNSENLLARSLHPLAYQNNPSFRALMERTGLPFRHYDAYRAGGAV